MADHRQRVEGAAYQESGGRMGRLQVDVNFSTDSLTGGIVVQHQGFGIRMVALLDALSKPFFAGGVSRNIGIGNHEPDSPVPPGKQHSRRMTADRLVVDADGRQTHFAGGRPGDQGGELAVGKEALDLARRSHHDPASDLPILKKFIQLPIRLSLIEFQICKNLKTQADFVEVPAHFIDVKNDHRGHELDLLIGHDGDQIL